AGHEAPLVYRAAENRLERAVPDEQGGFPLCWVPGFCYTSARVELRPGDSLILFTDGIPDALNAAGGKFGREGIFRALDGAPPAGQEWLRPGEIGERVIAAVREHAAGHSQFDDIALVCFGRVEDPVPKTFRIMAEPLS